MPKLPRSSWRTKSSPEFFGVRGEQSVEPSAEAEVTERKRISRSWES